MVKLYCARFIRDSNIKTGCEGTAGAGFGLHLAVIRVSTGSGRRGQVARCAIKDCSTFFNDRLAAFVAHLAERRGPPPETCTAVAGEMESIGLDSGARATAEKGRLLGMEFPVVGGGMRAAQR